MKKYTGLLAAVLMSAAVLGACGTNGQAQTEAAGQTQLQTEAQTQAIATEQETVQESQAETTAASAGAQQTDTAQSKTAAAQTSGTAGSGETYISAEEAKEIVLTHAGLTETEVTFIKVKQDVDDGRTEYELEFYDDSMEYDYELDAVTGEVLSYDHEAEYRHSGDAAATSGTDIGEEKAKELALERAGLQAGDVSGMRVEYEWDDGIAEYEVKFYVGQTEYEVTLNGETGAVISYEEDQD